MELTDTQKRAKFLVERSWIFLLFSLGSLLLTFVLGQRSLIYIAYSFLVGLIYSVFTLAYWKWEKARPLSWIIMILALVVVIWGERFVRDLAFPGVSITELSLWLLVQYFSIISVVFFGALLGFRSILRRHLYPYGDA
jgi:hypothetical protein